MKRTLLLGLLLLPFSVFAQDINSYQFKRDFLAYEAELPAGFQAFLPDTIQRIQFNPAKAIRLKQGLFSSTYFGSSGGDVDIRFTGYIRSSENKGWYFTYAGLNRENTSDLERTEGFDRFTPLGPTSEVQTDNQVSFRDDEYEIRLLRVSGNRTKSQAFGLVLAYETVVNTNLLFTNEFNSNVDELFDMGNLVRRVTRSSNRDIDFDFGADDSKWVTGLEHYRSTPTMDVVRRLSVEFQNASGEEDLRVEQNDSIIDEDLLNDNTVEQQSNLANIGVGRSNLNAVTFRYTEFRSFSLNEDRSENLFYQLDSFYGSGADDVELFTRINSGPTPSEPIIRITDDLETQLFLQARAGYSIRRSFQSLTYMTGFQLGYAYAERQTEGFDVITTAIFQEQNELSQHQLTADLPLFVRFELSDYFAIWGGSSLGYTFDYITDKTKEERNSLNGSTINLFQTEQDQSFATLRNNYVGLAYTHYSGFRALLSFRDNFNNAEVWRISVIYPF
jgi:hypothetical protein